jgi:hypothetical protein
MKTSRKYEILEISTIEKAQEIILCFLPSFTLPDIGIVAFLFPDRHFM